MADAVRVGLDRFVLDALGGKALEQRIEPGDGEGDPTRARLRGVRLDEERGVLVDFPQDLVAVMMSQDLAQSCPCDDLTARSSSLRATGSPENAQLGRLAEDEPARRGGAGRVQAECRQAAK